MKASCRKRSRLGLAVAGLALLPMLALAQQPDTERAAPPLPERLRTLDESLQHEHDDLVQQATAQTRDGARFAAALKAQQAAWLHYRDTSCACSAAPRPA